MADLGQTLDTFQAVPGVQAAVVASRDGLLIDGRQNSDGYSLEELGAMAASLVGELERLAAELDRGEVRQAMIEFGDGVAIVVPAGDLAVLGLLLSSTANLGRARLTLQRSESNLRDALAAL